ncbi:MAG: S53 family peptidase, partial [Actinomycetes bacterium]
MARAMKWIPALLAASLLSSMLVADVASAKTTSPTPHLVRLAKKPQLPLDAKRIGQVSASRRFTLTIGLAPKDPSAFDTFVRDVSTPGTPNFRKFLRRGEYARRFGPTAASLAPLVSSLRAAGFRVDPIHGARQFLKVSATAAGISNFFHAEMAQFKTADGSKHFSVTGALRVDATLKPLISGVSGLGSFNTLSPSVTGTRRANVAAPSCQTATDYATSGYGVTTTQLASAYGLDRYYSAGNTGQGVTIGIYELARYKSSDISAYAACYGVTPNIVNINVDGGPPAYSPAYSADATEPTLDISHVISIAPGAKVLVYQSPNSTAANPSAPNDLLARIASDDLAQVITTSWGLCESDNPDPGGVNFENGLFKQMAAQGQTFIASSGDNGPADCAGNGSDPVDTGDAVDDPASQPFVTGVGATRTTSFSPLVQSAWGRGSLSGGGSGGGISAVWPRPSWQVVSSTDPAVTASTMRMVPDVALNGDPRSGVLVYQSDQGGWFSIGGTSAASPLLAAITALAATGCQRSLGFLNPALYQAALASSANFSDVTSGTNSVGSDTVFNASTGYDLASGLGTPLAGALDTVCATSPSTKSSSTLIGRPTTIGFTFTSTADLAQGDTVTVTWPAGLTLPSNPASFRATANDDPSALTLKLTTNTSASATPNQAVFTIATALPKGSLFTVGVFSAINPSEKLPQNLSVTSSVAAWTIVGASLPDLTGQTSPWSTRDLTATNKSLAGKATLGSLTLNAPTTSQIAVVGTKVFLTTGTAPTLAPITLGFTSLTKATGTFTGQVQFVKTGTTFVLAGVSTTGHLLLARTTNVKAKWQIFDATKTGAFGLAPSGALCMSTVGATPRASGAIRLSNGHLVSFVAASSSATSWTFTDLATIAGLSVSGAPACAGDGERL